MTTWDDFKRTCMHGVREGLDDHDCSSCQEYGAEIGLPPSRTGWFFSKKMTKVEIEKVLECKK